MATLQIQLFPLQSVLYPHCVMPLHIFEPRYRTMIKMCLEHGVPFGIVQIVSGLEVGGQAKTVPVGTVAKIVKVTEFDDGRMFITTQGEQRFRILESAYDGACMTGVVETFEDEPIVDLENVREAHGKVKHLFRKYWQLLETVLNKRLGQLDVPEDPEVLSWLVPSILQMQPELKQAILEKTSCLDRLEIEQELLLDELENLLEVMRDAKEN